MPKPQAIQYMKGLLDWIALKRKIQMTNNIWKACSILSHRKIKSKTPFEVPSSSDQNGCRQEKKTLSRVWGKKSPAHCWGERKLREPLWTLMWTFLRKLKVKRHAFQCNTPSALPLLWSLETLVCLLHLGAAPWKETPVHPTSIVPYSFFVLISVTYSEVVTVVIPTHKPQFLHYQA